MTINIDNVGSKEIVAIENLAKQWFKDNAPQYDLMASSPSLMFAHIGERNMKSMITGTTVALLLISVLLIFALKDVRLGLISLIPNLAPAAIGFGVWSLWNGNVNLGLSVVTSMTLGIVVDDAVHFLSKYKRAREDGNNAEEAVRYAFSSVGRALLITTLVLVIGFLVLAQSTFAVNGDMGLLSAIIIFFALIVDFLFLPPFLILLDKKEYPVKGESNETQNAS
jgi:predicted RND superfamily exporter protein